MFIRQQEGYNAVVGMRAAGIDALVRIRHTSRIVQEPQGGNAFPEIGIKIRFLQSQTHSYQLDYPHGKGRGSGMVVLHYRSEVWQLGNLRPLVRSPELGRVVARIFHGDFPTDVISLLGVALFLVGGIKFFLLHGRVTATRDLVGELGLFFQRQLEEALARFEYRVYVVRGEAVSLEIEKSHVSTHGREFWGGIGVSEIQNWYAAFGIVAFGMDTICHSLGFAICSRHIWVGTVLDESDARIGFKDRKVWQDTVFLPIPIAEAEAQIYYFDLKRGKRF
mmetsp:Transcript_17463/g.48213  ORF Transcript_17463/g.48213 Transcript_17463/m.48213 type:complete len:278 (+) Transcript_17463:3825-4658(+)